MPVYRRLEMINSFKSSGKDSQETTNKTQKVVDEYYNCKRKLSNQPPKTY